MTLILKRKESVGDNTAAMQTISVLRTPYETFVSFREKCKFRMYIKKKSAKYGQQICAFAMLKRTFILMILSIQA